MNINVMPVVKVLKHWLWAAQHLNARHVTARIFHG